METAEPGRLAKVIRALYSRFWLIWAKLSSNRAGYVSFWSSFSVLQNPIEPELGVCIYGAVFLFTHSPSKKITQHFTRVVIAQGREEDSAMPDVVCSWSSTLLSASGQQ